SWVSGELAPSLLGRQDLARYHTASSTLRNFFPSFRGPAYSRAGTAFVGFSKQTGRSYPPRLITFQFSINQGLALEIGNFYMRVISQGAFVTDESLQIQSITQTNPAVVTISTSGASAAVVVNPGTSGQYAPGDTITLNGGNPSAFATLQVVTTKLLHLYVALPGSGYIPGDTINLAGGVQVITPVVSVLTTQVSSAAIA